MTPEYISLQETMTVGQALQHIRDVGMDSETVYTCYVKKGGRKLKESFLFVRLSLPMMMYRYRN